MPGQFGEETFYPRPSLTTQFVVKNIAPGNKTIRIFQYPIANGMCRDLLRIPYVSEDDIRHSLLKGTLMVKIRCKEIEICFSNINLLQFDPVQRQFLLDAGLTIVPIDGGGGLIIGKDQLAPGLFPSGGLSVDIKQNQPLIGIKDGINRIFTTADKFINGFFSGSEFRIIIRHNGKGLEQNVDYTLLESGGVGTGFDTIVFISFIPIARSRLLADYVTKS